MNPLQNALKNVWFFLHARAEFEFRIRNLKFTRISVTSRTSPFHADISLRKGTSDWDVFCQIFLRQEYDLGATRASDFYRRTLQAGQVPLILDLGANVGLSSLYFAKNWPEARIIAVEPDYENFCALALNTKGHAIEPMNVAVSNENGYVRIANPEASAWEYRTEVVEHRANAIPALDVKTLLTRAGDATPFIAKIDVEGFERQLFAKNTEWVRRFPIIAIELHDRMFPCAANSQNFLRAISQLPRDFFISSHTIVSVACHD